LTSLRKAAQSAQISPAYLSQLEAGAVGDPSPRVLYGLATVYAEAQAMTPDELYRVFMNKAGYVVPGESVSYYALKSSPLERALRAGMPITPTEQKALTEYLAWFRSRHGRSVEGPSSDQGS
jgi:hypothetical protein